jgi:cytochrome c556
MIRKSSLLAAASAFGLLAGSAMAQAPSRADGIVVYRKALYQVMFNNWAPLSLVVQDKAPFDAKAVQLRVSRANFAVKIIPETFTADSVDGKPTRAKPELWANKADFDQLMGNLQKAMTGLDAAAKTGKLDKVKAAFGATRDACKACHDKYRTE